MGFNEHNELLGDPKKRSFDDVLPKLQPPPQP